MVNVPDSENIMLQHVEQDEPLSGWVTVAKVRMTLVCRQYQSRTSRSLYLMGRPAASHGAPTWSKRFWRLGPRTRPVIAISWLQTRS